MTSEGSAAGGAVVAGEGSGAGRGALTHLTKPEIKVRIDESELLLGRRGGGLYAFEGPPPISAGRRTVGGLGPSSSAEVVVPEAAAGAFHKPPPTGIINLIRRGAGVRVAPGSVDLATGRFIPWKDAGRFDWFLKTPEAGIAAIDVPFTAMSLYWTYQGASWTYDQVTKDSKSK